MMGNRNIFENLAVVSGWSSAAMIREQCCFEDGIMLFDRPLEV